MKAASGVRKHRGEVGLPTVWRVNGGREPDHVGEWLGPTPKDRFSHFHRGPETLGNERPLRSWFRKVDRLGVSNVTQTHRGLAPCFCTTTTGRTRFLIERDARNRWLEGISVALLFGIASACTCSKQPPPPAPNVETVPVPPLVTAEPTATAPSQPQVVFAPATLVGSAIARSPDANTLYVADEMNAKLHVVPLRAEAKPGDLAVAPRLDGKTPFESVTLPGPPAQVVVTNEHVFVTIRNPGLLWIGTPRAANSGGTDSSGAQPNPGELESAVAEAFTIDLPADAFGLTLTASGRAVVTSAWPAVVSYVDIAQRRKLWSLDVAREPRGVVVDEATKAAWITHLVGSDVTRVALDDAPPAASERVNLPAAPLRAPDAPLAAALGYSAALSPDGQRYYVARHALGAQGKNAWFGAATVDVLDVATRSAVSPARPRMAAVAKSELAQQLISGGDTQFPGSGLTPFTQPRAILYRKSTRTLLVAGEGDDRVAELDADALDPTMAVVATYPVGADYHRTYHVPKHCAAPAGLVLSQDESRLWVYCAATNDVAEVLLSSPDSATGAVALVAPAATAAGPVPTHAATAGTLAPTTAVPGPTALNDGQTAPGATAPGETGAPSFGVIGRLHLLDDPLGPGGSTGRKLFYSAIDFPTSGGLACAGCHPEGRDDGHVWHEATFTTEDGTKTNFVGHAANIPVEAHTQGYARRTPMLAGRVNAPGPYGWHGESASINARVLVGFGLHRWGAEPETPPAERNKRAAVLLEYVRRGLVAPARDIQPPTEQEQRGKALFENPNIGCAICHPPTSGFTTRRPYRLTPPLPLAAGFDEDPESRYKIPDLRYLKQRAPYFHDGSAPSLKHLLENNDYRMGNTATLSAEDRGALQAYLETL